MSDDACGPLSLGLISKRSSQRTQACNSNCSADSTHLQPLPNSQTRTVKPLAALPLAPLCEISIHSSNLEGRIAPHNNQTTQPKSPPNLSHATTSLPSPLGVLATSTLQLMLISNQRNSSSPKSCYSPLFLPSRSCCPVALHSSPSTGTISNSHELPSSRLRQIEMQLQPITLLYPSQIASTIKVCG